MTDNIYAPPLADLSAPQGQASGRFYVVSRTKFFVLFILSLGLYQIYWSYKNWSLYKRAANLDVWPVARGLFPIFFVHALYRNVDKSILAGDRGHTWDASLWATLFVVLGVLSNLLEVMVRNKLGGPLLEVTSVMLVFVQAAVTWQGQRAINVASDDPRGEGNAGLRWINYLVIVPGAIMWLLILLGTFAVLR
ncbi:hypothetical protein [Pseudomonas gingeri]